MVANTVTLFYDLLQSGNAPVLPLTAALLGSKQLSWCAVVQQLAQFFDFQRQQVRPIPTTTVIKQLAQPIQPERLVARARGSVLAVLIHTLQRGNFALVQFELSCPHPPIMHYLSVLSVSIQEAHT